MEKGRVVSSRGINPTYTPSSGEEHLREEYIFYSFSRNIPIVPRNNLETNAKAVIIMNRVLFKALLLMNAHHSFLN